MPPPESATTSSGVKALAAILETPLSTCAGLGLSEQVASVLPNSGKTRGECAAQQWEKTPKSVLLL